jgi:iron complex transport system permease protein
MRTRRLVVLLVLVGLVAAAALASIAVGTRSLAPGEVWRALFDDDPTNEAAVIVQQLRVPRTVLGLIVGAALGMAGALMQGHTRNPPVGIVTAVIGAPYLLWLLVRGRRRSTA